MLEHSTEIDKISMALSKAQGSIEGAVRDSQNPHFRNVYASLGAVIDAVRGPLCENELAFIQATGLIVDGLLPIETRIVHASGQWFRSTLQMPIGQAKTAQAVGSAISYGRRYALMTMLGVPSVDDDGEEATRAATSNGSDRNGASSRAPQQSGGNRSSGRRDDHPDLTTSQRFADKILGALSGKTDEASIRAMEGSGAFKDCYDNLDDDDRQKVDAAIQAKRDAIHGRAAA